jgi:hypothetical protein
MSKDKALAFLKHAAENAELQQKIVALAAQEGYQFTVDELTDAELDAAAGGVLISDPFLKLELSDDPRLKLDVQTLKLFGGR